MAAKIPNLAIKKMADIHTINKGDKVRFLNEKGEGVITRIDKKYVYVLVTEGFELPVLPSEVVVVEKAKEDQINKPKHNTGFQVNYNYAEREDDFDKMKEGLDDRTELIKEVFLAFVKKEKVIELYMINPGDYFVYYSISSTRKDGPSFIDAGKLEPGMQAVIDEKEQARGGEWESLRVQCLLFHPQQPVAENSIDRTIKVSTKLMYNDAFAVNDFFDEPAIVLNLLDKNPQIPVSVADAEKLLAEKEAEDEDRSKRFQKRPEKETVEVDLHIEKLLDDFKGMTNHEMLTYQMNHFRKELETALKNKDKVSRIVFIHGIGNGTLKLQLRKQLEDMYPFLYFQDASFAEYGFGATMVMLDRMRK